MRRRSRRIPLQPVVTMPIRGVLPKLLIVTPTRKHPKATKELPSPRVSPLNMTEGKSTDGPKETGLLAILFTLSLTFTPPPSPRHPKV